MKKFLDQKIYEKAKEIADKTYKKHSAYKSMFLLSKYEELGGRINKEAKKKSGLKTWTTEEKWKNLTPYTEGLTKSRTEFVCGERHPKQKAPTICRPLKEVKKYTKAQLKKALEIKKKGKTINWKEL